MPWVGEQFKGLLHGDREFEQRKKFLNSHERERKEIEHCLTVGGSNWGVKP
jgi:hypothetical protein